MKDSGPKDLQTVYRIFMFIRLLSAPPYHKATELAEKLGVSKRTIYNYIKLLEAIGYEPDADKDGRHFLPVDRSRNHEDGMDVEDATYLQEMLWQMPDTDSRRNQLLLWLNKQYATGPVIQRLTRYTPAEHRSLLTKAIEQGARVRLMNYRDAQGKISNRYAEPVAFQQDYTYIYVYDLDREAYRQFHLGRVGYVSLLEDDPVIGDHAQAIPDLFGWTGPRWYNLRLELSPRAQQLLLEEYPMARPYVVPLPGGQYLAELNVRNLVGVGRWVLGLCEEVGVLAGGDGEGFRIYLNAKFGEGF